MSDLDVAVEGGVALLTLNRPGKRNALSIELRRALAAALAEVGEDPSVRCTAITGAGEAFCAGMDVTQFGGDDENRRSLVDSTEALFGALDAHPKPLVAAVNGPALGGGFAMALRCDLRVAAATATFGFPEVARGIPVYGAARATLPRAVAADLCLTGRTIGAQEALGLGVVSRVGEDLLAPAREIAGLPPRGIGTAVSWIRADRAAGEQLEVEMRAFREAVLRPAPAEDPAGP